MTAIDLAAIARLARRFGWRTTSASSMPGRGSGRRLGSAGEFEGYRRYQPGDDLRHLDLRVWSRLRRPVVRVLREDSVIPVTLLVDRSASMAGDERERAVTELTAFFLCLARQGGDPVRAFTFSDGSLTSVPSATLREPSPAGWLGSRRPRGTSHFRRALRALPPDPAGRGVVLIISDAMGIHEPEQELAPLRRSGLPYWFAPLELAERHPGGRGRVRLRSREHEPSWSGVLDTTTHDEYRRQLEAYFGGLRRRFCEWGGDLFVLPAEDRIAQLVDHIRREGRLIRT